MTRTECDPASGRDAGRPCLLVESIQDYPIFMLDPAGHIASWSAGAERVSGYRIDEVLGKHCSMLYPPSDGQRADRTLSAAAAEGRYEGEGWLVRKDGTRFWASVVLTAIRDEEHRLIGYSEITRDHTDGKRREDALRERARLLELVFEGTTDAIYAKDTEGRYVLCNPAAAAFLGRKVEQVIGRTNRALMEPESAVRTERDDHTAMESGRPHKFESTLTSASGDTRTYLTTKFPWWSTDGSVVGIIGIAHDITERARTEEDRLRLMRAEEAVRLRDELIALASHELRTPLTPLQVHLQSLARDLASANLGTPFTSKIDKAQRELRRLERLTSAMLDVSRIAAGRMNIEAERVDLATVVREASTRCEQDATRAGSPLRIQANGPIWLTADPLRIEQLVANLLSNAIKFGAGRPIDLTVERAQSIARLSVIDRGIGIAPEQHERIFERFARAAPDQNYPGLGVGLYIARQVADAHRGRLYVQSRPGEGARFVLELPLGPERAGEAAAARA